MAGSAICRKLLEKGYLNLQTPTKKQLDFLNLQDTITWFNENDPKIVILAAAKVGGILANKTKPADFILENTKIQTNVIETAWRKNVKKLILSAFFGMIIRYVFYKYGESMSSKRGFGNSILLVTICVASLIAVVKSSLALSLGLVDEKQMGELFKVMLVKNKRNNFKTGF